MKICSIHIKGFQQFQDTILDFTHPETGEPLDKICLIGKNGTGKSTILLLIDKIIRRRTSEINDTSINSLVILKIENDDNFIYECYMQINVLSDLQTSQQPIYLLGQIDEIPNWKDLLYLEKNRVDFINSNFSKYDLPQQLQVKLRSSSSDLFIQIPSESVSNSYLQTSDVPITSMNAALNIFKSFPFYHIISSEHSVEFWNLLIYHLKKSDEDQKVFENLPENLNKTKRQLIEEFDQRNPKILTKIGELWNRILDHTGLEFDVEGASNPIQLTDNLKAYIKVKATGERIQYNQLSTGIRNFIFRLGHIYSLYFNREIKRGFLLVDEPENSLFPDFLYDLIDIYHEITMDKNGENNTQSFFATHNPIIAAQFEPYERIILEWNAEGTVVAHKGVAPLGDDPNDLLKKDFEVRSLMGTVGVEKHKEYLTLRRELRNTSDEEKKKELLSKIGEIARAYEFD